MGSYITSHIIVLMMTAFMGTILQFVFWSKDGRSLLDTLLHWPLLWLLYLLISALVVEHGCRILNRRSMAKDKRPPKA